MRNGKCFLTSCKISIVLRIEIGGVGSMMNPPNPSTDVGSLEGVRIAKHAMKKATKKARFLESASFFYSGRFFPICSPKPFLFLSLSLSLSRAQIHTTEIRRTHESSVSKQSSSASKKKKRKNVLFGLADFAKDLNKSLLETTADMSMKGGRSKKMSRMLSSALLGQGKKKGSRSKSTTNNKKRELIARVENDRMKMVLKHPTFKANPVKAVLTHLAAQLGESAENDEEERSKGGTTKKTTKKSTTTTTNNNVVDDDVNDDDVQKKQKKRKMMTPARLRQTQGKHHAGGGQERSKKSIHGGGKNSGGVAKEKLRNKKGGKNKK